MNGEPMAFPVLPYVTDSKNWSDGNEGMTLRDYFAAVALGGLDVEDEERAAKWCYQMADAMLAARGKS
jgi:hypothetical protein